MTLPPDTALQLDLLRLGSRLDRSACAALCEHYGDDELDGALDGVLDDIGGDAPLEGEPEPAWKERNEQ